MKVSEVTGYTDINTGLLGCFGAPDQDLALDNNPYPDIIFESGGKQVIHASLFLTILTSSDSLLSLAHESLYLSLSSISPPCIHSS